MPWEDRWGEQPDGDDHLGMADLALAQTRNTKKESPDTPMGGRLLVAELTQHNLFMAPGCELSITPRKSEITFTQEDLQRAAAGNVDAELSDKLETALHAMKPRF